MRLLLSNYLSGLNWLSEMKMMKNMSLFNLISFIHHQMRSNSLFLTLFLNPSSVGLIPQLFHPHHNHNNLYFHEWMDGGMRLPFLDQEERNSSHFWLERKTRMWEMNLFQLIRSSDDDDEEKDERITNESKSGLHFFQSSLFINFIESQKFSSLENLKKLKKWTTTSEKVAYDAMSDVPNKDSFVTGKRTWTWLCHINCEIWHRQNILEFNPECMIQHLMGIRRHSLTQSTFSSPTHFLSFASFFWICCICPKKRVES